MLLVELTGTVWRGVAEDLAEGAGLEGVADRGARGVGVDVVEVVGIDPGVGQGRAHRADAGAGVGAGDDDVVGVAAGPHARDLAVDAGPAASGRSRRDSRTNIAPPSPITKPSRSRSNGREAGFGRVVPLREGPEVAEPGHAHRRDRAVAGAGEADVDPAPLHPSPRLRQGDVAAGAGRGDGRRRAADLQGFAGEGRQAGPVAGRVVDAVVAAQHARFPGQHPLAADPEDQADPRFAAAAPTSRRRGGRSRRSRSETCSQGEPRRANVVGVPALGGGHRSEAGGDLAGLIGRVEVGRPAGRPDLPRQEVARRARRRSVPSGSRAPTPVIQIASVGPVGHDSRSPCRL